MLFVWKVLLFSMIQSFNFNSHLILQRSKNDFEFNSIRLGIPKCMCGFRAYSRIPIVTFNLLWKHMKITSHQVIKMMMNKLMCDEG